MGIGNIIGGVASIGGALIGAKSAKDGSKAAAQSADQAVQLQREIFNTTRDDFKVQRGVGERAINALDYEMGLDGKPGGYRGFEASPGYAFAFGEGMKAVERSAAARGGLNSGATMKALNRFGQGVGAQEYKTYLNGLRSLAGVGQQATGATAQAGQSFASNGGNALLAGGHARASGYAGVNNAIQGGLNNLAYFGGKAFG